MAAPPLSRNPFADPNLPSFGDLLERLKRDQELPLTKRQNCVWAKALARAAGKEPGAIPAHREFLRSVMKKAAPESIGLSRAAWNNVRSLIGKVLKWADLASMPGHYQAPFAPEWQQLWDQLPAGKNALSMQLSHFFHFCSAQAIAPVAVNDEVMAAFNQAFIAKSIVDLHMRSIEARPNLGTTR